MAQAEPGWWRVENAHHAKVHDICKLVLAPYRTWVPNVTALRARLERGHAEWSLRVVGDRVLPPENVFTPDERKHRAIRQTHARKRKPEPTDPNAFDDDEQEPAAPRDMAEAMARE